MTDADLSRVQRDLQTMQEAVGTELPFGRNEIRRGFLIGLLALPLVFWTTLGPGTHIWMAIAVTVLAIMITGMSTGRGVHRQRFEHPLRWKEFRYQMLGGLAAGPFALLIFYWAIANGTPLKTMLGLVLLITGGVFCFVAVLSRRRRSFAGMGVALTGCGSVMPWCTDRGMGLAVALLFLVGLWLSATIQAWQLRRVERSHAAD
jgi:hypothetical protein